MQRRMGGGAASGDSLRVSSRGKNFLPYSILALADFYDGCYKIEEEWQAVLDSSSPSNFYMKLSFVFCFVLFCFAFVAFDFGVKSKNSLPRLMSRSFTPYIFF